MESFEHVTKIWLEARGFAVSSGIKFPVAIQTRKQHREETQEHGYEIDLVGARAGQLVLVNVKSYFGSKGFSAEGLLREKMFSNEKVFEGIVDGARKRFGYQRDQMAIYVVAGRIAPGKDTGIRELLERLSETHGIPINLFGIGEIADGLLAAASRKMYIDDPVIVTVKSLRAAGRILERQL